MLTPALGSMSDDAQKRLVAIESLDTLGAGFALASQDLEIRGAGELLGESQSGMIDQIGYSLYSTFLEQAIATIQRERKRKRGEKVTVEQEIKRAELNFHIPARFPDAYLPDVHLRLTMYKRISNADDPAQLDELQTECIDRFGLLPDAAKNLFTIAGLKLAATHCDIRRMEVGPSGGEVEFNSEPTINIDALMQHVAKHPREYRFAGTEKIHIQRDMPEAEDRFALAREFLELIKN
jgi:transcription-repair coupling factor (superfamily II helicase)